MLTRNGQHCFKSQCEYLILHTTKYEIIGVKIYLHKFPRLGSFCWKPTSTNHFNAMKASQPLLLNCYRKASLLGHYALDLGLHPPFLGHKALNMGPSHTKITNQTRNGSSIHKTSTHQCTPTAHHEGLIQHTPAGFIVALLIKWEQESKP